MPGRSQLFRQPDFSSGRFFQRYCRGCRSRDRPVFWRREKESLQRSIHTTIAFGLICGVVLSLVGVIFAPKILILMGTPDEVLPNSTVYFQIYFAGSIFFVMYNIFVGILQAVGDSRHPLYYLIISSITNVILDLILVAGFRFGVGAAALATTISQALSAALCLRQLLRSPRNIGFP